MNGDHTQDQIVDDVNKCTSSNVPQHHLTLSLTFNRPEVVLSSVTCVSVFTQALQQRLLLNPFHIKRILFQFAPLPPPEPAHSLHRQLTRQTAQNPLFTFQLRDDDPPNECHPGRGAQDENSEEGRHDWELYKKHINGAATRGRCFSTLQYSFTTYSRLQAITLTIYSYEGPTHWLLIQNPLLVFTYQAPVLRWQQRHMKQRHKPLEKYETSSKPS